jgi:hypothetical protein
MTTGGEVQVTVVGSAIAADPAASVTTVGLATTVASVDPVTTAGPVITAEATMAEATMAEAAATAKPLPTQVRVAAPSVT